MTYSIPETIARKYLGLRLHADLAAPDQRNDLPDILDPEHHQPGAFCGESDLGAYEQGRFEAMKSDMSVSSFQIDTLSFTFPVFDEDYRTAIVVITGRHDVWYRTKKQIGQFKPGDVGRFPPEVATEAEVYRKTPSGWRLISSEELAIT